MQSSPFSVAGMSSTTSAHHSHGPNLNAWSTTSSSGSLTTGLGDSLSQSRSHYQPGYMLSASQSSPMPQGNQRVEEAPLVQTKAKLNNMLRGTTSDFGMESMFQSSRQRQTLVDEDAPPRSSVNDIPNEIHVDSPARFQRSTIFSETSFNRRHTRAISSSQQSQTLYVVVFGYPSDKYSQTVEYFKSFGESTEADPNTDITNCFRIGYKDPGDAMRAVRKNGEVLAGSWMIGVKWADPAQAEALLGQPISRNATIAHSIDPGHSSPNSMAVDQPSPLHMSIPPSVAVGTPIKLAPSSSAFKKPGTSEKVTPQRKPLTFAEGGPVGTPISLGTPSVQSSPSKGVLGQVSDFIFGW